ncbi:sugar (pentulose or hexulose) kinase [Neobacillus niacini]|uniref:FGGY-family carbohydrate kinase n=1 Tax=Neobacillus driksii TaxID=3035913 RepID=UPI002783136F|nr:FGGY family carbohydrate kinase [Neobacillus niacini]MDQ0972556.1 sugar (pentulose or hexulose) kinase [Neobacillus niacini]
MFLSIDIGTTNLKAGLFDEDGSCKVVSSRQTPYGTHPDDRYTYIDPQALWSNIAELIEEVLGSFRSPHVRAVSITSMAESGLLLNADTGKPATEIIPWFDDSSIEYVNFINNNIDSFAQFCKTGLHTSFKYGLAKLLWLRERDPSLFNQNVVWLSISSFIGYCLTGEIAEEQTLAARTFVYQIDKNKWDDATITHFDFNPKLFPHVTHCLKPIGNVKKDVNKLGLNFETKVYLAGHDHICSSLAAGIVTSGHVYNSMGTAETLVGTFTKRKLTLEDYESGLSFGIHPIDNMYFWMGGHSSSGGSIEWMRDILGDDRLTYEKINSYLEQADEGPTGIIFYPYLSGSGAPNPNPHAKAAFLGLKKVHQKPDLLKAVLEGNAFQMEMIREAAETTTRLSISTMSVIGGGVRNPYWMQIKADVSFIDLFLPNITEAALCGAALTAATGEGIYPTLKDAVAATIKADNMVVQPDHEMYKQYRQIYKDQYKPISKMIEKFS